jgi:acetyl esterase/lipase
MPGSFVWPMTDPARPWRRSFVMLMPVRLKKTLAGLAATLAAAALAGCSQLAAFDALAPKDPAARAASGIAYGSLDRQRLDIYAPPGGAASAPVVVFFYGGGWDSGRRQDYSFAARAIASRGFVTVVPDYRLYPQVVYPAFLEDGAAAVRWVQDHAAQYGGDPGRILLAGHSAGAYNAVQLTLDTQFLEAAGVDLDNIIGAAGLAGPYDFLPLDTEATINAFGQYPDLEATQPINHVRAGAPPIFLAHGTGDTTVGLYHTENLTAALSALGAPVDTKIYEGVTHEGLILSLSRPFRGRAPLLSDMTDFLRRAAGEAN